MPDAPPTSHSDEHLVARVLVGSPEAEDEFTPRVRAVAARVAEHVAGAERVDEILAPVLLEMLQSERRWLPGWLPGSVALDAYVAVVAARTCIVETDRWRRLTGPAAAAGPIPVDHPSDLCLASAAAAPAPEDPHIASCPRCHLIVSAARAALRNS
jgi:hypothetical protein